MSEQQEDPQIVVEVVVEEAGQQPAIDELNQEDVPHLIEEDVSDDDELQEQQVLEQVQNDTNKE